MIAHIWGENKEAFVDNCTTGTIPGRGDLQPFQNAVTVTPDTYSISSDVTSALSALPLPTTVYVSVRCYNLAGLPSRAVTDGVTIVDAAASQQMDVLRVMPDSVTQYPVQESCHVHQDRLRLRWGSVTSQIPLVGFEVREMSGLCECLATKGSFLLWADKIKTHRRFSYNAFYANVRT